MFEAISERVIQRGFQTGELLNASDLVSTRIPVPTAVTKTLWRSLLWPYPTAQSMDYIDLAALLAELPIHFPCDLRQQRAEPTLTAYVPCQKPSWLSNGFAIGIYLKHPGCMLLFLKDDPPPPKPHSATVPSTLIVKLLSLISRLSVCARKADQATVLRLLRLAQGLAIAHPLGRHITRYFASERKPMRYPSYLTRDEYRASLLEDLGNLIEVISACGLSPGTVLAMTRHHDVFCSPMNELIHQTRVLLRLAVVVPDHRKHLSPEDELLAVYSELRNRWTKCRTPVIPEGVIRTLHSISFALSKLLPKHVEEISRIRQSLGVLESISDGFAAGMTYPPRFHLYH